MEPSADDLYRSLYELLCAAPPLPLRPLTPEQRAALGGSATRAAPRLVRAVCRALRQAPQLYAELPIDPEALAARQERALGYRCLHAALLRLAERARVAYLLDQAQAAEDARLVVRHARLRLAAPARASGAERLGELLRDVDEALPTERRGPRRRADRFPPRADAPHADAPRLRPRAPR